MVLLDVVKIKVEMLQYTGLKNLQLFLFTLFLCKLHGYKYSCDGE